MKKAKRKKIPTETIFRLWAMAAGRCEFKGCNQPLWREKLTLKEVNISNISHIIASSPNGPRGDKKLSKKMECDFSNLMLLCPEHHKLVDDKKYEKKYPVELLQQYKKSHERRIELQTGYIEELSTTILTFKARVGDRNVEIPIDQAIKAIEPKYPSDARGIELDFTSISGDNTHYWESLKNEISRRISINLCSSIKPNHLSIFGIGSIPLLIHLGKCIGNIIPSDIYQRHRDTQDWCWKKSSTNGGFRYYLRRYNTKPKSIKVALVLSLSGKIHAKEVTKIVGSKTPRYEISIKQPNPCFIKDRHQLLVFKQVYRETLGEIRKMYGPECKIYLFPAVPVSIAVLCGQELLPKTDPSLLIYDKNNGHFAYTLTV